MNIYNKMELTINQKEGDEVEGINIIICMAGRGSRFLNAGYTLPKPLIKAKGEPIFTWAVKSLEFYKPNKDNLIFICLKEHIDNFQIDQTLKKYYPNCKVISINSVTEGQACTVLLAKKLINNSKPLCIFNSDTFFKSNLNNLIREPHKRNDGIITIFYSENPNYSYAKLNNEGFVTEVAEKKIISNDCTVGMYFFSKGSDFVNSAERMILKNIRVNNEFYVGPCYNELILEGKKIVTDKLFFMYDLGTPEALTKFEKEYHQEN